MNSLFRETIEKAIADNGLEILVKDKNIFPLIKATDISVNNSKTNVTYKDATGDILCSVVLKTGEKFPSIGRVFKFDARNDYLKNYEKTKLRVFKFKCNKTTDADIIDWLTSKDNMQASIKQLIRNAIKAGEDGK